MIEDQLDPENAKLVKTFIGGYFAGYREGMRSIASLLQRAEKENAPVPKDVRKYFSMLGNELDRNLDVMMKKCREVTKESLTTPARRAAPDHQE